MAANITTLPVDRFVGQDGAFGAFGPLLEPLVHFARIYFKLDTSQLIPILVFIASVAATVRYCTDAVHNFSATYLMCSAEINMDDSMYSYLMYWVSQQRFARNTKHFIASTRTSSSTHWDYYDDELNEQDIKMGETDSFPMEEFDSHWARVIDRVKVKPFYITPSHGTHTLHFRGHYVFFSRSVEKNQTSFRTSRNETLFLSSFRTNHKILRQLLEEAREVYLQRDKQRTVIYRGSRFGLDSSGEWQRCLSRLPRKLSTVILDHKLKQELVDDLKSYLHPMTERWYADRGIPYRRGYLLYGPPGTGKTSLCVAIAARFRLDVYVISLNSKSLTEESLASLFSELPARCIVLLEDVDSAGIADSRKFTTAAAVVESTSDDDPSPPKEGNSTHEDPAPVRISSSPISLSALLNVIDGVASNEGRVLIMTTNHIESLDAALLRPGRVDMTICFTNASTETIRDMFLNSYQGATLRTNYTTTPGGKGEESGEMTDLDSTMTSKSQTNQQRLEDMAEIFSKKIPSNRFSPAAVQGYLLMHKNNPQSAVDEVDKWVEKESGDSEK
ncbi:putative bcs1-like protein [Phaeomoniella chlamydospora]|uniref:Putative bcs1-like protein n=1 Tax=Phaeomoniella chlamydospora TaxID=158046 RepID=A0A0G2GUU3_PHACM|nr:putative bcs1-like protein [Phaeomoniella chlamydospora]